MICSYLLHGCHVIQIFNCVKKNDSRSSSVQFENENDLTPSAINMNR